MRLPPAYQFPTTTVFIDDNMEFIEAVQSGIESDQILVKKFDDPKRALNFLQNNTTPQNRHHAWTRISPSENDFDSVSIEVKFSKICSMIDDKNRSKQITTVVVDYQMPEVDGLTFLAMLKDFPVRKILLTGIADAEIAIKALDRGLIDAYVRKHDHNLLRKIQEIILNNQVNYFQEQSSLINSALKISQENDNFLSASYCDLFQTVKEEYKAIEHYLMDENGSCMFLSKNARVNLVIKSIEQINSEDGFVASNEAHSLKESGHLPLRLGSDYYYTIQT